jgi:hypothetical protein
VNSKKTYSSPQLFRIELNHEQAILSACSLATTAAFNGGNVRCNTTIVPCKKISFNLGNFGPRAS